MKTLAKYLSLLLLSRLILPYCLVQSSVACSEHPLSAQIAAKNTQHSEKQCRENEQSFWFLRDAASDIFPVLKNLN